MAGVVCAAEMAMKNRHLAPSAFLPAHGVRFAADIAG
jgi:hypothetical protein